MKIDIQNMSDNELITLKDQLVTEIEVREKRQKKEMWEVVQKAITAYTKRFGFITIDIDCDIDESWDFTMPGDIHPPYKK